MSALGAGCLPCRGCPPGQAGLPGEERRHSEGAAERQLGQRLVWSQQAGVAESGGVDPDRFDPDPLT